MAWPGDRVQQMVIAKLSPRLSLNNLSNIWDCSKVICHKNEERKERKKKKASKQARKRDRDRERASEFDAKWYGNCRKQGTTIWISLIRLARSVNAWFTPSLMDCRVWSQVIAFRGPYRFTVFRAHLWQKTPTILKWSSTILKRMVEGCNCSRSHYINPPWIHGYIQAK